MGKGYNIDIQGLEMHETLLSNCLHKNLSMLDLDGERKVITSNLV